MPIIISILQVFVVIVSLLIILLVLMQRPKNEGLGAAFGGGMTENIFGAQTTNVLQTLTRNLGIGFFLLTITLSWLYVKAGYTKSNVSKQLSGEPVPAATPPPDAALEASPVPGPEGVASDAVKAGETVDPAPTPAPVPDASPSTPQSAPDAPPATPDPAPAATEP
jgi:preprotein translocase subunit SecG